LPRWRALHPRRVEPEVPADAFRPDSALPHLQMNFRVVDEDGRQLAMGRNVAALKEEFGLASGKPDRGSIQRAKAKNSLH
jgi:hypothetical protein